MKLKSHYLIFLLKILCFALIAAANMSAQEKSFLTSLQSDGYNLGVAPFSLRVPVAFKEHTNIGSLNVQIIDVSREQERDGKYLEAFGKPALSSAGEGSIPFIEIQIDPAKLTAPGIYTLHLGIVGDAGQQLLAIQLTRPAAKIRLPPTLSIIQESFPLRASSSRGQSLVIEPLGDSPISELNIIQQEFANSSGDTSDAQIKFNPIKYPLVSGSPSQVGYEVTGNFPLGKNTGKIRLSSPQMAEPLIVNFEVVSRRSILLIFVSLLLGLGAGYLSRVFLKHFIERRRAIGKSFDLENKLENLAEHPDQLFKKEIEIALDKLKTTSVKSAVGEIDADIAAASQILAAAQFDLQDRKKSAVAEYNKLVKVAELKLLMPPPILQFLEEFEAKILRAKASLEKEAVLDFQQNLETAKNNLAEKLRSTIGVLVAQERNILEALKAPAAFSATVAEKVADADKQIRAKIQTAETLSDFSETPSATDLKIGLQAVYEMREESRGLFGQLIDWIRLVRDEAVNTLRLEKITDAAALAALDEQIQTLSNFLKSDAASAPDAANEIVRLRPALANAWREAISRQSPPNLPEAETAQLQEKLEQFQYVKAAEIIAELNKKRREAQTTTYLGANKEAIRVNDLFPPKSITLHDYQIANKPMPERTDFLIPDTPAQTNIDLDRARTRNNVELRLARLLQTVIIGFGIVLVGYLLFADTFIGTFKELTLIFFWAFGLDVTLDNLVEKATRLKT